MPPARSCFIGREISSWIEEREEKRGFLAVEEDVVGVVCMNLVVLIRILLLLSLLLLCLLEVEAWWKRKEGGRSLAVVACALILATADKRKSPRVFLTSRPTA